MKKSIQSIEHMYVQLEQENDLNSAQTTSSVVTETTYCYQQNWLASSSRLWRQNLTVFLGEIWLLALLLGSSINRESNNTTAHNYATSKRSSYNDVVTDVEHTTSSLPHTYLVANFRPLLTLNVALNKTLILRRVRNVLLFSVVLFGDEAGLNVTQVKQVKRINR